MTKEDDIGSAATVGSTDPSSSAAPANVDPPSSLLANRYEILGLLGVGGMGRVYRAHDRSLDETVALKMLRRELLDTPGMLERFRQEVKLARRVTNPHVVRTFDLGDHEGEHFLTMEYIDGRSLSQVLEDQRLSVREVLRIARAACAGIAAAHAAAVLHRDLKPDNILVAKTGRIAITDFGIARASTVDPGATVDRFVGTPAYMSPEQVEGDAPIGPPTDIYSFGAILFEMLVGRRPFVGKDALAIAVARIRQPPPDPRAFESLPDALADLVLRCLARDPLARFADAAALGEALAGIADHPVAPIEPKPVSAVPAMTSRSVALLPLRAAGDLAEIAEGLTEEIVDALTMTRALRVRPLASVRRMALDTTDPREIGRALDVDVVVDGSIRRRSDRVRITARAIGVTDGFQLWANHFDCAPDELLAAGDEVARAVARSFMVEIAPPTRIAPSAPAVELYLEGKAKMRAAWFDAGAMDSPLAELERAHELAPEDAGILASLAMCLARSMFYGRPERIARAREFAARAVSIAPASGDAWLASGIACLYDAAVPEAAHALRNAVSHAPGSAMAQATFGAILLEAGALDDAIVHLEAATRLDPVGALADLPRAYFYAGRHEEAFNALANFSGLNRTFADDLIARLRLWRGEHTDLTRPPPPGMPADFQQHLAIARRIYRTRTFDAADRVAFGEITRAANTRLRLARCQFMIEFLMLADDHAAALEYLQLGVDSGLQDYLWMKHCPMLAALRELPAFREYESIVAKRAADVLLAVRASHQPRPAA